MSESGEPTRKRRKVSLACAPCRERKIRCSGERPVCASCHQRSKECSYAVQLEYVSGVTESIHSMLERLKCLENQNQSTLSLAPRPNVGIARSTGNVQKIDHLVQDSESSRAMSSNTPQSPSKLHGPSSKHGVNHGFAVIPRSQPSDLERPQRLSLNISDAISADETAAPPWTPEAYMSPELVQTASGKVDAMGASSVCDESSPQDSTQFYGNSSGVAFMRVIRHVLGDSMQSDSAESIRSSTDWTNIAGDKGDVRPELSHLLPAFEGSKFFPELFTLPPRSLCETLLESYWNRVYPLYPFVHRPTFEAAYATLWNPVGWEAQLAGESDAGLGNIVDAGPLNQTFYCALNMMLALGSQFQNSSMPQRSKITAMFEQRSKNLLVVDMLDRGGIAIIQTLLLTGQFLQSTFCTQRCWNCIGVACRIAQGLGLHVDQSSNQRSPLGREIRRRVWYTCMMLDMSTSMTMGRPLMILHKFSTPPPLPLDDEKHQDTTSSGFPTIRMFSESIRLSKTLGIILTTIYDQNISNADMSAASPKNVQIPSEIDTVLELDKRLTKFQNEVPTELQWNEDGEILRQSFGPDVGNLEMQSNVLHARFLQTRILLYRTTFTRLCQETILKGNQMLSDGCTNSDFDMDNYFMIRGAISCITSARELIKLIHLTLQSTSSDAWWYNVHYVHTAGMVVKMAQHCNPLEHIINASSLDQSWALCRETLSSMSSYGQVPQQCLESLEALQEKISQLELSNSKMKSHLQQQSESALSTSQQATPSNTSGRTQSSPNGGDNNTQLLEPGIYMEESMDGAGPLNGSLEEIVHSEYPYPSWSTDLTDWWNFPGGDFSLNDMSFAS